MELSNALGIAKQMITSNGRDWPGQERYDVSVSTILRAAASGDLIPASDAGLAVAGAVRGASALVLDWQGRVAMGTTHANAEHDATLSRISTAILALADQDALAEVQALRDRLDTIGYINEPTEPGAFTGDIWFGHSLKRTMGTHRWTGSEWAALPSEMDAVLGLLAQARSKTEAAEAERDRLAVQVEALQRAMLKHVSAIERLACSAGIASCTCDVKTPDITFHSADCRYVKLQYILAQCEELRDIAAHEKDQMDASGQTG